MQKREIFRPYNDGDYEVSPNVLRIIHHNLKPSETLEIDHSQRKRGIEVYYHMCSGHVIRKIYVIVRSLPRNSVIGDYTITGGA